MKQKILGIIGSVSLSALAILPTQSPSPTPISPLVKPDYVPKRLQRYEEKPILLLMEADRQREIYEQRKNALPINLSSLRANRVYLYFLPRENRWYQVVTDSYGKLKTNPMEYLRAATVLPGSFLGAKNPFQNYFLGRDRLWTPTFKKEHYEFWVDSTPPLAKYVDFDPMPKTASNPKGTK